MKKLILLLFSLLFVGNILFGMPPRRRNLFLNAFSKSSDEILKIDFQHTCSQVTIPVKQHTSKIQGTLQTSEIMLIKRLNWQAPCVMLIKYLKPETNLENNLFLQEVIETDIVNSAKPLLSFGHLLNPINDDDATFLSNCKPESGYFSQIDIANSQGASIICTDLQPVRIQNPIVLTAKKDNIHSISENIIHLKTLYLLLKS